MIMQEHHELVSVGEEQEEQEDGIKPIITGVFHVCYESDSSIHSNLPAQSLLHVQHPKSSTNLKRKFSECCTSSDTKVSHSQRSSATGKSPARHVLPENKESDPEYILPCVFVDQLEEHPYLEPIKSEKEEEDTTVYLVPDSTTNKSLSSLPACTNWEGEYGFNVNFTLKKFTQDSVAYSEQVDKLFVTKGSVIPVAVSTTKKVPRGAVLRAMAVFVLAEHASDVVRRCPGHAHEDASRGKQAHDHLIHSVCDVATYETDPVTGRHSVVAPFKNPDIGEKHSVYLYKFMCFNSCIGGINRRPVMVIFTLELGDQVLGRRALEVKICAAPHRDMRALEMKVKNKTLGRRKKVIPKLSLIHI